jgi:hypothetical protein
MRRLSILFSIALVFALVVVAAATAAAPGFCDVSPEHWKCATTTTSTTTTTQPPQLEACSTDMTITGNGQTSFECLWTPVNDGSTVATVTVSGIEGGIKAPPGVFVRDDSPGDICLLEQEWVDQTEPPYVASFDLYYDEVPDERYEAWLGYSYWDFIYESENIPTDPIVGAYWCSPQDPVLDSLRIDTNGTPLHFQVSFNARGGGQFDITLSPGQG